MIKKIALSLLILSLLSINPSYSQDSIYYKMKKLIEYIEQKENDIGTVVSKCFHPTSKYVPEMKLKTQV